MRTEISNLLTSYLMGWKTLYDLVEWLAGIEWDNPEIDPNMLELMGRLELLATEAVEGLRSEADFWKEAAEFVASETCSTFFTPRPVAEVNMASSTNDIIIWPLMVTAEVG